MGSIAEIRSRSERVGIDLRPYLKGEKKRDLNFKLLIKKLDRLHRDFKNLGKGVIWEITTPKGKVYLIDVNKTDAMELFSERFGLDIQSVKLIPTSKILSLSKENDP